MGEQQADGSTSLADRALYQGTAEDLGLLAYGYRDRAED